jgi:hypothetical protein
VSKGELSEAERAHTVTSGPAGRRYADAAPPARAAGRLRRRALQQKYDPGDMSGSI